MNRTEYLAGNRGDRDEATRLHRAYYGQLVNEQTIAAVALLIGRDRILASTDPHLNDIPLKEWDRIIKSFPLAARFDTLGDYPTLAGLVCVAKEAARQLQESAVTS